MQNTTLNILKVVATTCKEVLTLKMNSSFNNTKLVKKSESRKFSFIVEKSNAKQLLSPISIETNLVIIYMISRQTDIYTDQERETERQTDRQTDRQSERERETDRQTDRQTYFVEMFVFV